MTTATKTKRLEIILSRRPPIKIDPELWGVIASVADHDGGQIECQARHKWRLLVRRHADGRAIVYGWERAGDGGAYAGYRAAYAGELLAPGADVPAAIQRVGASCRCERLVDECIGNLPAEVMD